MKIKKLLPLILAIILVLVVFVILLQDGQRKIAVQYSQKIAGRNGKKPKFRAHYWEKCRNAKDFPKG